MSNIILKIRTFLFLYLERLKGEKKLIPLEPKEGDTLIVEAKSFFGYKVEIQVHRVVYECQYSNKLFRNQRFVTFVVSSKVDSNAPERIHKAFRQPYTFPKMLPTWMPMKHHMNRAVDNYIDMVLHNAIRDVSSGR